MPPKRKSDASVSSSSKKQRREDDNARAVTLVDNILANLDGFSIPESDTELREDFVSLAKYARYLQEQGGPTSTATARVKKSPDELEAAVEKVRKAAVAGIKKQMNVSSMRIYACFTADLSDSTRAFSVAPYMQVKARQMVLRRYLQR